MVSYARPTRIAADEIKKRKLLEVKREASEKDPDVPRRGGPEGR